MDLRDDKGYALQYARNIARYFEQLLLEYGPDNWRSIRDLSARVVAAMEAPPSELSDFMPLLDAVRWDASPKGTPWHEFLKGVECWASTHYGADLLTLDPSRYLNPGTS